MLNKNLRLSALTLVVLACLARSSVNGNDRWSDLTGLLPGSANAILAIDVEDLFESPLAKKNNWRESHANQFDRVSTLLPPIADRFLLAAELDIEHFEPNWEFAAMTLTEQISLDEIRDQLRGKADTLAGIDVVRTNRDSFVVPFEGSRAVVIRRAQRQWASRQVQRALDRPVMQMPSFLEQAVVKVAEGNSQIAVAVFLADAVPESEIRTAIGRSTVLSGTRSTVDELTALMTSMQGFVLTVNVSDAIHGKLEMVFSKEPKALQNLAKPLILEILGGAGALLPEFGEWVETHDQRGIGIEGRMTGTGLRRVLSLLNVDSSDFEPSKDRTAARRRSNSEDVMARATDKYVRRITKLVRDIETGAKSENLREQVLWTDRCAKTISRMSTQNVDPRVTKIGQDIAYDLMKIVSTFHYATDTARSRSSAVNPPAIEWQTELIPYDFYRTPFGLYYRYAPFNYARINIQGNTNRSRQITSEEITLANDEALSVFAGVKKKVAEMNAIINGPGSRER